MPGAGRTIQSATEERAQHVRKAVHLLEPVLRSRPVEADLEWVLAPRWDGGRASPAAEPASNRAAWALVNTWLLATMAGGRSGLTFADAEDWFVGSLRPNLPSLAAHIPPEAARPALRSLSHLSLDDDLLELLPYVMELHGPGSRLSVMRDPSTQTARQAKRESGVFYTPADVAEYMASVTLDDREGDLRCLDPSCGTGVFLVALLRTRAARMNGTPFNRFGFATRSLYGFDISTTAVESCVFVLLHHCLTDAKAIAPWSAWHALRLNLTATDSLRFRPVSGGDPVYPDAAGTREQLRRKLVAGGYVAAVQEQLPTGDTRSLFSLFDDGDGLPPVGAVFPEAEGGFDVLVGNPPYAMIGRRKDARILEQEYASLREGASGADFYPAFIEFMWRLTRPGHAASSLVVPLSIAYHQGQQFTACRQAITANGGRWRFAFFDREPHALFGEYVKTRNAIIFRTELPGDPPRGTTAELHTGPLYKWTSRTRDKLFSTVRFTPLRRVSISDGIPKLSGLEQAQALSVLSTRFDRLRTFCERYRTCRPHEATLTSEQPRVFVASTAYNFLNVFRSITIDSRKYPLSENTVHCVEFAREEYAQIAFAVLSSRLTYWLWHVRGDGFHVGAWFIQNLPFGPNSFTPEQTRALQDGGRQMWESLQAQRIVSVNKGKQTVAYRPLACERERDVIDEVLLDAGGLPKKFIQTLKLFVKTAVIVDDNDARRSHLKSLFDAPEANP